MIKYLTALLIVLSGCTAPTEQKKDSHESTGKYFHPSKGKVEVIDPILEELIDQNISIEILAEGFNWSEGPLWVAKGNFLLFSDVPKNTVYKWSNQDSISIYLSPSGYTNENQRSGETGSNGLMLNAAGQLILCQHGDRRVAVLDSDISNPISKFTTLSDSHNGKKLNSPNDLDIHTNGDIYYTDPPYGLEYGMEDSLKELNHQGVYRWSAADSTTSLQYEMLTRPNGIALAPDERSAIVANSDPKMAIWTIFDVNEEGSLHNGRQFYDVTEVAKEVPGLPDGMAFHKDGHLFATGPGGVWILSSEGKLLGKILTGQLTSNCTFSDDYKYLYMTANSYLLRIELK